MSSKYTPAIDCISDLYSFAGKELVPAVKALLLCHRGDLEDVNSTKNGFMLCENCERVLRLPLNKGEVLATCPVCDWQGTFSPSAFVDQMESFDEGFFSDPISALFQPMWAGFFGAAEEGHTFSPVQLIFEEYGKTLEENYPNASMEFMNFAKSYWTLKLRWQDLVMDGADNEIACMNLLSSLDFQIGSVFFPTPGPANVSASRREKMQRDILKASDSGIDVESFIEGNPVLSFHRRKKRRLMVSAILLATVLLLAWQFLK